MCVFGGLACAWCRLCLGWRVLLDGFVLVCVFGLFAYLGLMWFDGCVWYLFGLIVLVFVALYFVLLVAVLFVYLRIYYGWFVLILLWVRAGLGFGDDCFVSCGIG